MACEVPVIATNVGGLLEVVQDGVDGFLVQPGNVREAARYVIEILSRICRQNPFLCAVHLLNLIPPLASPTSL
jgi:glycosyltransferase involved in cell wall biosynthesis